MIEKVNITKTEILSQNLFTLKKISYQYKTDKSKLQTTSREVYDRGNGVAILLFNKEKNNILLTKQLRIPTYVNGNNSGMMIEVCAGMLDEKNPDECVKREVEEETGYRVHDVTKIFQSYMSPGAVTEILHFYIAEYNESMKVSEGGGLDEEHENIEVLAIDFDEAYNMIYSGEIQDSKTIMLLQYAKIHKLL